MTNADKKTILSVLVLVGIMMVMLSLALGFKGFGNDHEMRRTALDTIYNIRPFKLPDSITFAGEKMPLDNFDTRESLEREILISAYRHSSTILIIKRANRYLPLIEKILKKNNIPDDFKYLAAAESDYSNMVSPAGATGFWQIMPETGREQGLEINTVVDERYNVEKSTQFACDFFLKSYEKYGNWTLTAASYNGGRAGLDEQIEIQNQYNYYDLLLNEETGRYIFRAIAYKLVITDPAAFGFNIGKDDLYSELKYHEVNVDTAVNSFADFAEKFGTNYKILKFLNPWLRKPYLTPKQYHEYQIKIPDEGMRNIKNADTEN